MTMDKERPFDIMCTATMRPEILKRTFDSFITNLFGDRIKDACLHINIDRAGTGADYHAGKLRQIMRYLDEIPFRSVRINIPDEPSFSRAFYWCLGGLTHDLTFNLEEDWELLTKIDFDGMVNEFDDLNSLVHLRLSSFGPSRAHELKQWNKWIPWNGKWFTIPRNLRGTIGWCGHPSLNRTSFLMFFASLMDPSRNPEKQIKGAYPIILDSLFGVYHKRGAPPAIKDIGRKWMVENGYQKQGSKAHFTNWERNK